jgi:hypothetical protein
VLQTFASLRPLSTLPSAFTSFRALIERAREEETWNVGKEKDPF